MRTRSPLAVCLLAALASACAPTVPTRHSAPEPNASVWSAVPGEATIADLQARMQRGELSAHRLVQHYLERIAALDRAGPTLNAIIELNPDALAIADALDAERTRGRVRGPLHGIPVLLKDNIDTADRMHTSAGSLALAGSIAPADATVAARLRDAGAVILGKTNLSEWANFRSLHSSSGWSARGGQTKNPYALDRNPCGSSSGTAVAIAANLAVVGVGTETDGSIVCPAAVQSLVGIKPTLGLVSRAGIIPIAHSQDTAGPIARSLTDAVVLLDALSGADPRDPLSAEGEKHRHDYPRALAADGLRGARIGVVRKLAGFNPDVDALLVANIAALRAAGAIVVDPVELPHLGKYDAAELTVLEYEFKHDLDAYLAALPAETQAPRSLAELIAFNARERAREMPWFGQDLFEQAQARGPLTDKAYREARANAQRMAGRDGIDAALKAHRLDALIAPTAGPAWLTDWVNGDHTSGGASTPAAVAGYPHITVPAGFVHGLPIGLSFFGAAWSEPKLIRYAYAFEQATRARRAPRFLPRLETP